MTQAPQPAQHSQPQHLRAHIQTHYRLRLAVITVMVGIFVVLFFRDGYVVYPKQLEIHQTYKKLEAEGKLQEWPDVVKQRSWDASLVKTPPKPRTEGDILFQKVFAYGLLPVLALFGWSLVGTLGRWVALENDGLLSSSGFKIFFTHITRLDKSRWNEKGIAIVYSDDGNITLDDWKFDKDLIKVMLEMVESHLKPEQIEGDISEAAKLAAKQQGAQEKSPEAA